jgi:hypothetical protein
MMRLFYILAITLLFTSCISDFEPDKDFNTGSERIPVLISFLNPDSLIKIDLYWSKALEDSTAYSRITNVRISLHESEKLICDTVWQKDSSLILNQVPTEGLTYKIRAEIPGKEPLSAQTTIPEKILARLSVKPDQGSYLNLDHDLEFTGDNTGKFSIWIVVLAYDTNNKVIQAPFIYSDILFADDINKYANPDNPFMIKYNYEFESFIRFTRGVLHKGDHIYYIPFIAMNKPAVDHITSCIISASPEYDLYSRSAYKQISYDVEVKTPLLYQPVRIFTNIKNGQGVFAGYNNNELIGFENSNAK